MSPRFSATTTGCLVNAGWHPGRHAPVLAGTETALAAAGHELLPSARAFLTEFGGLTVMHPHFRVTGTIDHFIIDALLATNGTDQEWVREYERRTKERALTPVGEASRGYLVMCMDAQGAVYGGYDDVLLQLGTSGDDTLEALCTGREPLQIR